MFEVAENQRHEYNKLYSAEGRGLMVVVGSQYL